ncbi:hypothetical protein LPJ60_000493 [Coemansia sp. RSA 2675]|uniref:Uncharacterized protein n=1 Tax=Coemansia linderi TaxID=2663919 RepID=A0ACC1KPF7_9FUNG|nr:hypothetical protein LPJ60_000493 [Coemansia sp. RSA 2675]KAJ2792385.1 hypothetical protein GGI18_000435 [Coemansia linderi]
MVESIITSVNPQTTFARTHGDSSSDFLPSRIVLNVRGRRLVLDRETLNHLPDSLLNTMFPNGLLHVGRGYGSYGYGAGEYPYYRGGGGGDDDEAGEQTWVDFDPDMLEYVLRAYGETLDYDLLGPSRALQRNSEAQATGYGQANSGDNHNNESDNKDKDRDAGGSSENNPGWLNYGADGKASIAAAATTGTHRSPPNDSTSTFTDTGSHVNSSSGATQSTSSSAVLNYMRFVADVPAHGGSHSPARNVEAPVDVGVAYYDRNPLVVLREELDYFVVPSSGRTRGDVSEVPGFTLDMAKTRCGELLVEDDSVFEPLERTMQRNQEKWKSKVNSEGASDEAQALQSASVIEQQLIDMLCLAGFPRDARWGCRRVEPSKTSVTSLLTVPLDESADQSRIIAAQKLLLFYKKPARKCWWEGEDVNAGDNEHKIDLKLWCRRTWTLELVLI